MKDAECTSAPFFPSFALSSPYVCVFSPSAASADYRRSRWKSYYFQSLTSSETSSASLWSGVCVSSASENASENGNDRVVGVLNASASVFDAAADYASASDAYGVCATSPHLYLCPSPSPSPCLLPSRVVRPVSGLARCDLFLCCGCAPACRFTGNVISNTGAKVTACIAISEWKRRCQMSSQVLSSGRFPVGRGLEQAPGVFVVCGITWEEQDARALNCHDHCPLVGDHTLCD